MIYKMVRAHNLSPLRQVSYILKCISEGITRNEIVKEFGGDEQLVSIWINYLIERNYLDAVSAVTNEGYAFLMDLDSRDRHHRPCILQSNLTRKASRSFDT